MQDLSGVLLLLTAAASGFGAWVALWLLRYLGVIAEGLKGLSASVLLRFSLLYAAFNALFHQVSWWSFKRDGVVMMIDIWPMFIGDLLGALVFLYGWKFLMSMSGRNKGLPQT
jgi:hypothetical protein